MRTRRSRRNQDRLYRAIAAELARAAAKTSSPTSSPAPPGYEADPALWPCPDGPYCRDPLCLADKATMDAAREAPHA